MGRERAIALYRSAYGEEPAWIARGPGRINLIGEHTDYSGGFVFPAAIDREVWLAAGPATTQETLLVSEEMGQGQPFRHDGLNLETRQEGWTKYPAAMAWALGAKTPIRGAVASTLPPESGVSSSAAIEMAFGVLWNELEGLGLTPMELALKGQEAENKYVGVPCGIMDQLASALGRSGQAMFVDTRSLAVDYAPVPDGLAIVLCDTGKRRQLTGGEYKERRDQVESAARKMGVALLRDATPEMLGEARLTDLERRRARHVITENLRCRAFAQALKEGDLEEAGQLLADAHASMRDDFGASVAELDAMTEACGQSRGCVGARLTGAGFGGACVALVQKRDLGDFLGEAEERYRRKISLCEPRLVACEAADGAELNKL